MRRSPLTTLALCAFVVACGGSGAATSAPTGVAATQAAATDAASADDAAPTPGTKLDACGIVTPEDIKAATGATDTVDAGVLKPAPTVLSPGGTQCRYEGSFGRVTVDLTPEDGANLYDAAVGAYEDADPLSGLGDGAFNSEQYNRAFVWKGAVTVMLTMFLDGGDQKAVAQALGAAIISKL